MKKQWFSIALLLLCPLIFCACGGGETEHPGIEDPCTVTYTWYLSTSMEEPHSYSVEIPRGSLAQNISLPGDDAYKLEGWYYGDRKWDFLRPVEKDIVLEANWSRRDYTVSYMIGDYVRAEALFCYGEKAGDPYAENPERFTDTDEWKEMLEKGYTFAGWVLDGQLWDFENDIVKKDMVLEALFVPAENG